MGMEFRFAGYRIQIAKEYKIDGTMPRIYNEEGRLLETYFIKTGIPSMRHLAGKENISSGTATITGLTHISTVRNP